MEGHKVFSSGSLLDESAVRNFNVAEDGTSRTSFIGLSVTQLGSPSNLGPANIMLRLIIYQGVYVPLPVF